MANITPQALDFLFENRIKDSKSWYQEHKQLHKELVTEPFKEFIVNMGPYIEKIDPTLLCSPKKISRIYRDTRFTKDKTIFRDNVWTVFMHGKGIYEGYPCFYFDFSPRGFNYGCGYYKASTDSMDAIRELILKGDKAYISARKAFDSQDTFFLEGESYKRNRFPDAKEKDLDWLNRKTVCFIAESKDFNLLFGDTKALAEKVGNDFMKIKPIYDFLMKAESRVHHKDV